MKFIIDFNKLDCLPTFGFFKSNDSDKLDLVVNCPFDLACICEDVYADIKNKLHKSNCEIELVFEVSNYNISIDTLKHLLDFSEKNNVKIKIKDMFEKGFWSYVDFVDLDKAISAVEKLDKIVEVVKENNFSPLETLLYAYIFATKRPYKEEGRQQSPKVSRSIFEIFNNKNIVCTGYCNIIKAIVQKYDDSRLKVFNNVTNYPERDDAMLHATLIAYVKDQKYDLDTYCYLDPTADSEVKAIKSSLSRNYYLNQFMIPLGDLKYNVYRPRKCGFLDIVKNDLVSNNDGDSETDSFSLNEFGEDLWSDNSFAFDGIIVDKDLRQQFNDNVKLIDYYSKKYQALKQKNPSMTKEIDNNPKFLEEDLHKFSKPLPMYKLKFALKKVMGVITDLQGEDLEVFVDDILNQSVKYSHQFYDEKAKNTFSQEFKKRNNHKDLEK